MFGEILLVSIYFLVMNVLSDKAYGLINRLMRLYEIVTTQTSLFMNKE
jgi:hypothetical protein